MNRRNFFILTGVSSAMFFLSACSGKTPIPKKSTTDLLKESNAIYDYLRLNNHIALKKLSSVGVFYNDSLNSNTLIWNYGPNIILSKEDLNILSYAEESTLFFGMGLKSRLKYFTSNYLDNKYINLDLKVKSLGFENLDDMFLILHDRIANSTKTNFYYLTKSLNENKLNIARISEVSLSKKFFESYRYYNIFNNYVILNGYKVKSSIEDFTVYAAVLSLATEMIDKSIHRNKLYEV